MKKVALLIGAVAVLLAFASCTKERTCRCSVLGGQTIRVFKIDKGSCYDLYSILYDQDPVLYPDITDSLLCTDFDFEPYMNE